MSAARDSAPWDVIVVGAGPAGSSAAYEAASLGARVLVLEKAQLPRYKTCGGGIIGTSAASLPPEFDIPTVDEVRSVTFTLRGKYERTKRVAADAPPLFSLIKRATFDLELAAAAARAGATTTTGCLVTEVSVGEPGTSGAGLVHVRCRDGRTFSARGVVGADGSASRLAAHVGVTCDQVDLGLEAEVPVPPDLAARWAGRIALDWGAQPGSYAWVFPKGDQLSVGVISARANKNGTKRYFEEFIARVGLSEFVPTVSAGHLTRCRTPDSPVHRGRVFVAGDAAGLLEPWTREGISFALRSGRLAGRYAALIAEAADEDAVASLGARYRADLSASLGKEMRAGRILLRQFERRPFVFHAAVTLAPPAWRAFVRFMRGDCSFADILFRWRTSRRAQSRPDVAPATVRGGGSDPNPRETIVR